MAKTSDGIRSTRTDEEGATMVEYALILALVAIICMAGVSQVGKLTDLFFNVANTL